MLFRRTNSTFTATRDREHHNFLMAFTNPSSSSSSSSSLSSSSSSFSMDTYLLDRSSRTFQNNNNNNNDDDDDDDVELGFFRPEFRQGQLAGTVEFYSRHVFLCYKNPAVWPPRIDAAEFDRLPRLLHAAIVARKGHMNKETHLTLCEGHDGTETSNGNVLIFPDMIRYRRLTHFDAETFVEEVLVNDGEWLPGNPEALEASYVFVCSHGSHDRRCGICGPILVGRFREEIELHGLHGKVFVSPCSHIGGQCYAGNVIILGSSINGEVTGHWYGYVTPEDVPLLLQQHIIKGEILDSLWRGQMGITEDEQKKKHEQMIHLNGVRNLEESTEAFMQTQHQPISTAVCGSQDNFVGCCQSNGVSCCQENEFISCCQNLVLVEKNKIPSAIEPEAKLPANDKFYENVISWINNGKGALRKFRSMPTWLDCWEQEDTFAALAVVCAAVSVAIAYSCYKQL